MKLSISSNCSSSRKKFHNKDDSHTMTKISSTSLHMGEKISSYTSTYSNHKKSPILVIYSSKKISLFTRFTFSFLMMLVLALIQLLSYSLPLVECIERPNNFNKYFPYGIYNLQQDAIQRNSRVFPNFGVHRSASLRDSIPSSTYSKSIRRASKLS